MKPIHKPNTTVDGQFACAFSEPWLGPHPLCRAETARVCGVPIADVPVPDFSAYAPVTPRRVSQATLPLEGA
jgi:hypothetical protein